MPYIHTYFHKNEKEFLSNVDLTQGMLSIWQPLFEHRQPNLRIFNSFVKPIRSSNGYCFNDNHRSMSSHSPMPRSASEKQSLSYLNQISSTTKTQENLQLSTEFFVENDSLPDLRHEDISTQAPIVDMNSICSTSDLHRLQIIHPSPRETNDDEVLIRVILVFI